MVDESSISVVIRARNAEADLKALLPRLRSQVLRSGTTLQIVVVDNDSSDGTKSVSESHGAEVVHLESERFTWGRALNTGIDRAQGDLVIILSADARPIGDHWLLEICAPFADDEVAAVYGRQIPRPSAPLDEWLRVSRVFPATSRSWSNADMEDNRVSGLVASNACAALRRQVWASYPFDESSFGAEELPWCARILESGYRVVYTSDALVEHSHFERAFKMALRLWELESEKRRQIGQQMCILDCLRIWAAFAKTRTKNLVSTDAGLSRRFRGLCALPKDAAALIIVSLCGIAGVPLNRLRELWWQD